ncbi:MAG: hypothetical protein KHY83_01175 [Coriobacteriia bacterium]|nr:hypothetical protein [Coriobacteriia bacterium]
MNASATITLRTRAALVGAALALTLGAGGSLALAAGVPASSASDKPASSQATDAVEYGVTLAIGGQTAESGELAYVEVPDAECTPEGIVAALEAETGWDIAVADIAVAGNDVTVTLSENSAIFGAPPEQQKDAYHVFDAKDFVFSVLNSVATSISDNIVGDKVHFVAFDGGALDFSNGGYDFYVSPYFTWQPWVDASYIIDYVAPEGDMGLFFVDPVGSIPAGMASLSLTFARDDVEAGQGIITLKDSSGEVVTSFDVGDPTQIVHGEANEQWIGSANLRTASYFYFEFADWDTIKPGESYTVEVPSGAFVCADAEFPGTTWEMNVLGYGLGERSMSGLHRPKVGESWTREIVLDDTVERVTVAVRDPEMGTASTGELTKTGTVTFTPAKEGTLICDIEFFFKDGTSQSMFVSSEIVAAE